MGAGGGGRGVGGFHRAGAARAELLGDAGGCARGARVSDKAFVQDVQRLHDGAAEWDYQRVLSAGSVLQRGEGAWGVEGEEGGAEEGAGGARKRSTRMNI